MAVEFRSRLRHSELSLSTRWVHHLLVVDASGLPAAIRALKEAQAGAQRNATVLCVGLDVSEMPEIPDGSYFHAMPSRQVLDEELHRRLGSARMGLGLYVAGSDSLLGRVVQIASEHGLSPASMQTERCGPDVRRVQCVHCKCLIEDVTSSSVVCPRCGLKLLVRDHYSRRLGAYMGLSADAEVMTDRS